MKKLICLSLSILFVLAALVFFPEGIGAWEPVGPFGGPQVQDVRIVVSEHLEVHHGTESRRWTPTASGPADRVLDIPLG